MQTVAWGADPTTYDGFALDAAEIIVALSRGSARELSETDAQAVARVVEDVTGAGVLWRGSAGDVGTLQELHGYWKQSAGELRIASASAAQVGLATALGGTVLVVSGPRALEALVGAVAGAAVVRREEPVRAEPR
ncbi:hypothetical protein [Nigerium massiliense]|uniref:hypothetical protein n=1 Tax=Nigerium massiliense TaxID=1522317 RepID=UPI000590FFF1|nr:hypothetical protein [Nigerium massiliense]